MSIQKQKIYNALKSLGLTAGTIFAMIGVLYLVITLSTQKYIANSIESLKPARYGLVFGTTPKVSTSEQNSYFEERINGTANLYMAHKIDKIIVSGDNRTIYYNEPKAMRKALEARGIPATDIIDDFAGRDTYDSVLRARNIFGVDEPIFITQGFQAERALFIAHWNGISATAFTVKDPVNSFTRGKQYARESLARVKMFVELIFGVNPEIQGNYEPAS